MKIIITESKLNLVKDLIKSDGVDTAISIVGGLENFCKVLNINNPIDFLNLFNDLDVVQSEEKEFWTLFRYKKGDNLMVYDRKNRFVSINFHEIWSFLERKFGLKYNEIQELTKKWLDEVYNLMGITTYRQDYMDESGWMRFTI